MKQYIFAAAVFTASLMLPSCKNAIYDELMRATDDPFDDVPAVLSFEAEMTIELSWQSDECADAFVLYRKTDGGTFSEIYRGSATSWTDTDVSEWSRYLYRLDKIRGSETFTGSATAIGVASSIKKDEYENNDTKDTATCLDYDHTANMACFLFNDGRILQDVDWYYVTVPANRTANIAVSESGLTGTGATSFKYMVPGIGSDTVDNNTSFELKNTKNETAVLYFELYPVSSSYEVIRSGGTVRSYTVSLSSITKN